MSTIYELEEQSGVTKGQSCMEDNFTISQVTEKSREFNPETHIPFSDYKGSDRINCIIL
jgi:hypothetical protein